MTGDRGVPRGASLGDCAWCGGEVESKPQPPPGSVRGEIFCTVTHRDQSARAVKRLRDGEVSHG